jgi:hypothetical protein
MYLTWMFIHTYLAETNQAAEVTHTDIYWKVRKPFSDTVTLLSHWKGKFLFNKYTCQLAMVNMAVHIKNTVTQQT